MKSPLIISFYFFTCLSVRGQDTTHSVNYTHWSPSAEVKRPQFRSYPGFSKKLQPLKTFVPKDWTIYDSVSSDLNGDKLPDLAIVLQYKEKVNEVVPEGSEWENTPRILLLLFKDKTTGLYRLTLQNNHIIPRAGEGKQGGDSFDKLKVKVGVLTLGGPMGGEYSFRYMNGDFYLVSAWTNGRRSPANRYTSDGDFIYDTFYYYRIDFLKSRIKIRTNLMDGTGNSNPKEKEISIAKRPLFKLRSLKEFDERKIFKGFIK